MSDEVYLLGVHYCEIVDAVGKGNIKTVTKAG